MLIDFIKLFYIVTILFLTNFISYLSELLHITLNYTDLKLVLAWSQNCIERFLPVSLLGPLKLFSKSRDSLYQSGVLDL
jgi:hypothetical protein